MKKAFMTGVSSFTGCHIARAFCDAGWHIVGALTTKRNHYESDPLLKKRLEHSGVTKWLEEAPFGSPVALDFLKNEKIDVFINHGANIKGYRDANFDALASVAASTLKAKEFFEALKAAGCRRWVHSGSIFEPNEGTEQAGNELSSDALSLYGVSKKLAWDLLHFHASRAGLATSKIIIPNPIGVFENTDRMFPIFAKTWKASKKPVLKTPALVRDNIPAEWLAEFYVQEANTLDEISRVRRPSGFALSNQDFLAKFLAELQSLGTTNYEVVIQPAATTEPLVRKNSEVASALKDAAKQKKFWSAWLRSLELLPS